MKVNPQTFFNFCSAHVPLLRQLGEHNGEFSEAQVARLIRDHPASHEELPETAWRNLRELQILVPTEPGSTAYFLAEAIERLLTYLFDEANPATPEMVRGYIESLETLGRQLLRAIESDNVTVVDLAFNEINTTLRRVHADLEETQRAVQNEVAAFKVNREYVSVRDRFRRIVYWMERFVEPMIAIVQPDAQMAATFEETERLLRLAREQSLFNDHPALERNLRFLRLVRQHALRVFQECRRELAPLYESLLRSSFIAQGTALALERLRRDGLANWGARPIIAVSSLRVQSVPGDAAITRALRRVIAHPPELAPVIALDEVPEIPPELLRRMWLDELPAQARDAAPLEDLLAWLAEGHPEKPTGEILSGFSQLVFHDDFRATFGEEPERAYVMSDGELLGHPLRLDPL